MKSTIAEVTIPPPHAAQRLAVSWHVAYRMLLSGELRGEQQRGRWRVCEKDVVRLEQKRFEADLNPLPAA